MRIDVWCLMASMCLVSVKTELFDQVSHSFYEGPQSSSPAPVTSQSQKPELKEFVLFLTPDQVETLQAAGAVVRPYPKHSSEEKFQHSIEQSTETQQENVTLKTDLKKEYEIENYYKLLNIQEINDDLAEQPQDATTEVTTEKATSTTTKVRYKYTKSRQRYKDKENFTRYVPKKEMRTKFSNQITNSEYVRFLPNYESEKLKIMPYYALPLYPYRFEGVQANNEAQANVYTQEKNKTEENRYAQDIKEAQQKIEVQLPVQGQGAVNEKPKKPRGLIVVQVPAPTQHSVPSQINLKSHAPVEYTKTLTTIGSRPPLEEQQEISAPAQIKIPSIEQDQLSRLLAPLYQHKTITDTIARQKEELLSGEWKIQTKLHQIKNAPHHDDQQYATEIEKLISNLAKQNALAEIEAISKSSSVLINQEGITEPRPVEILKHRGVPVPTALLGSEPFQAMTSTQYPVPLDIIQSIPVPALKAEKVKENKFLSIEVEKHVPVPMTRNVYFKVDKPYMEQKVVPIEIKHEIPIKVPINRPEEQLTIIRHIWEH